MPAPTVKVVASALLQREGAILLLRRARDFEEVACGRGLWEPPGGRVEVDETIAAALLREVAEEAGVALAGAPRLVDACVYTLRAGPAVAQRFHIVYAAPLPAGAAVAVSDEHDAQRWVADAAALDGLDMLPELRAVVARHLAGGA